MIVNDKEELMALKKTSFTISHGEEEQLDVLADIYGCNRSAVIRRLISGAYFLTTYWLPNYTNKK
jgi:hypothetical protein